MRTRYTKIPWGMVINRTVKTTCCSCITTYTGYVTCRTIIISNWTESAKRTDYTCRSCVRLVVSSTYSTCSWCYWALTAGGITISTWTVAARTILTRHAGYTGTVWRLVVICTVETRSCSSIASIAGNVTDRAVGIAERTEVAKSTGVASGSWSGWFVVDGTNSAGSWSELALAAWNITICTCIVVSRTVLASWTSYAQSSWRFVVAGTVETSRRISHAATARYITTCAVEIAKRTWTAKRTGVAGGTWGSWLVVDVADCTWHWRNWALTAGSMARWASVIISWTVVPSCAGNAISSWGFIVYSAF